jgi:hypothetical protein
VSARVAADAFHVFAEALAGLALESIVGMNGLQRLDQVLATHKVGAASLRAPEAL